MSKKDDAVGESVAVEAGPTGFKIAAKGGGAARLSDALADLLSPFSNSMGLLGDQIGNARRATAFRAARKAVQMLEQEGIVGGNVPPKILLPWLEGVSLEAEKDAPLQDAWAGLLARAVKSSDAVVVSYMEVLKRIGSDEAKLLDFFAGDTSPLFSAKFYDSRFAGGLASPQLIMDVVLDGLDKIGDPDQLADFLEGIGLQSNCQVIYYSVNGSATQTTAYFDKNEHAVSNLEHLGLISINYRTFQDRKGRTYLIHWFEITKFAFDMAWACQGVVTGGGIKNAGRSGESIDPPR